MPWEPRKVRRVRSVSFETLMFQRTACSSICGTYTRRYLHAQTLYCKPVSARLSAGIGPGFGRIGNGFHELAMPRGGRKPVSKEIRALIFQIAAREPDVGCTAHSRRAANARLRDIQMRINKG